jgi:hypothetical protein
VVVECLLGVLGGAEADEDVGGEVGVQVVVCCAELGGLVG